MKHSLQLSSLRFGAIMLLAVMLAMLIVPGCGFQLYGQGQAPGMANDFSQLHLSSDGPSQQMMNAIHLIIGQRNQRSASSASEATHTLFLSDYKLTRKIDNITPAGIAIEYKLKAQVSYQVTAGEAGSIVVEGKPAVTAISTRVIDNSVTNQRKIENIEQILIAQLATLILIQVEDKLAAKPTEPSSAAR